MFAKKEDGKYYWSIEDVTCDNWEEISEELYLQLLKHNKNVIMGNKLDIIKKIKDLLPERQNPKNFSSENSDRYI